MKIRIALVPALACLAGPVLAADAPPLQQQLQEDLGHYLAARHAIEHISALSLSVSFPGDAPNIESSRSSKFVKKILTPFATINIELTTAEHPLDFPKFDASILNAAIALGAHPVLHL